MRSFVIKQLKTKLTTEYLYIKLPSLLGTYRLASIPLFIYLTSRFFKPKVIEQYTFRSIGKIFSNSTIFTIQATNKLLKKGRKITFITSRVVLSRLYKASLQYTYLEAFGSPSLSAYIYRQGIRFFQIAYLDIAVSSSFLDRNNRVILLTLRFSNTYQYNML